MNNPRRALVVDDNATNRFLAKALLTRIGWTVSTVDSGDAALALLRNESFPLVLLDISMPGLSGEEVCIALRKLPGGNAARVVAYTAHAFAEERERFLAAGFDDILVKPVTLQSMLATLGEQAE